MNADKNTPMLKMWILAVGLGAAWAAFSFSGYSNTAGRLRGTVEDPSGAAIRGAKVTVGGCGRVVGLTTNRFGYYEVKGLTGGRYTVAVGAQGFADFRRDGVPVVGGLVTRVDAKLAVGRVETVVEVRE